MTQSVDIYWRGAKVGTGTATAASATIASTSEVSGIGGIHAEFDVGTTANKKNMKDEQVIIHSTSGDNATGKSYCSRVLTHATTSLVLYDLHPFSD